MNKVFKPKDLYSKEDLVDCGFGQLFGEGNGRLPVDPMLMFDRITKINNTGGKYSKGEVYAELDVNPDLWFFDFHFKKDTFMPGGLGLDAMWQLLGFYLLWEGNSGIGRALGSGQVKFYGQVLPKAKLVEYKISIKRIRKQKLVIGFADGLMFVDGKEIYSAKDLRVGLFEDPQNF